DKLIKKELAFKYRSPENYRELTIELTPKGQLVYEYNKKLDKEEFGNYLKDLERFTIDDFQKIITLLNLINDRTKFTLHEKA
uniref:hypothetical protein n=1 Tax=Lysinibacillus fusiformis TaxID=28031 RepID=UPI0020BFA4E3